jgi:hypothetical protein
LELMPKYCLAMIRCIASYFSVALVDFYFGAGRECVSGSIQPVIYIKDGERQIGEMSWMFKLPTVCYSMRVQDSVATSPLEAGRSILVLCCGASHQ